MRRTALVAVLLLAALALVVAGCSEGDVEATPETVVGELPTETTEHRRRGPARARPSRVTRPPAQASSRAAAAVPATPFPRQGSTGTVGPNLDDAQPSYELAVTRVTKGQGGMPSFEDQLEPQQIADVAQYVVESTGG